MFTFNAIVTARVRTATAPANGSQPGDGADGGGSTSQPITSTDVLSGTILASSAGQNLVNGVDYLDIPFVAKPDSFGVDGSMDTSPVSAGALPDLDLQLLDSEGHVLSTSGNLGPKESVTGAIIPGKTYIYRVVGYVSGPTQVNITSKQFLNAGAGGSGSSGGGSPALLPTAHGVLPLRVLQFSVNPLTKTVTLK
jgi:hypothetical protein